MKKRVRLTKEEREIEAALVRGEYVRASKEEEAAIVEAIKRHRKDAVLNLRVNRLDLQRFKEKAKKLGVPYQSLLSELIHLAVTR